MKYVVLTAIAVTASVAPSARGQEFKDSVVADPDVHRVMFENGHVRVFRALAEPGTKSPMHSHPPTVLVSLATARLRTNLPDGEQQIFDFHPGQALRVDGAQHSWELLAGELSARAISMRTRRRGSGTPASPRSRSATTRTRRR